MVKKESLVWFNVVTAAVVAWEGLGGGIHMLSVGLTDPEFGSRTGIFLILVHLCILGLAVTATLAVKRNWRAWKVIEGLWILLSVALLVSYIWVS